jgi:RNA polymerase sigma-70 factor, ECF subfamily
VPVTEGGCVGTNGLAFRRGSKAAWRHLDLLGNARPSAAVSRPLSQEFQVGSAQIASRYQEANPRRSAPPETVAPCARVGGLAIAVFDMRRGDEEQEFVRLTQDYYTRIRGLVTQFAVTEEDRDDLTQEVLVTLYKALGSFRGESALGTWVYKVVRSACVAWAERHRAEARRRRDPPSALPREDGEDGLELLGSTPAHQHAELQLKQRSQALRQAIADLPREMRRVVLCRLQDRKYHEIAAVLGVSEETVKKQLSLARVRLRKLLGADFLDGDL